MKSVGIDFFTQFKFISNLRSNGAGQLSFILKRANMEENKNESSLWLWQGGPARQATGWGELRGCWWCGRHSLLLARPGSDKDCEREKKGLPTTCLQKMPAGGPGEALPVLTLHMPVEDVAALPDGRLLIVAQYSAAVQAALDEAGGDADRAAALLEEQADYEVLTELPFWANGGGYTSGKRPRLYLWDGKALTPLTDEKTRVEGLRLSPSGNTAFFIAGRYEKLAPVTDRLMRMDTASLKIDDITFAKSGFSHAAVVPLADDVLWVAGSGMREFGLNQNPVFYRAELDTGTADAIELSGRYSLGSSVGSDVAMAGGARMYADGDAVWWLTTLDESSHMMRMDARTGEVAQHTKQPGAVLQVLRDGADSYVAAMRGQNGPELYKVEPDGTEKRLTDFNTAVAKEYALAVPRPLAYTNENGAEIRGWVLLPGSLPKERRCPAILDIHGGPKTVYGPVLFHEMQYWAARGYAVVFCNPTGGDGRGDGFADIRGHYGEVDYRDIMGFLDAALAAHPELDPERLGVTGGSYGGFMTNWIITRTHRFKAAVSQRGISNWISMANTSDIGYYFVPDQGGADLWESPATIWGQSPLKFADRVKTPTLFIHSDEDYRCPLPEALQMYTALQVQGVDTRLCIFRGENHELSRSGKPKHRVRRLEEITAWFDKYLL